MRLLEGFLSGDEIERLRVLAVDAAFVEGRQATGYVKAAFGDVPELAGLRARSLAALGMATDTPHDAYLLAYPTGSSIPPHVDLVADGWRHLRLNAVIMQASQGGELTIDGIVVPLAVGQAVVFSPDREVHAVSEIVHGERLLWSVGCLLRDAGSAW